MGMDGSMGVSIAWNSLATSRTCMSEGNGSSRTYARVVGWILRRLGTSFRRKRD